MEDAEDCSRVRQLLSHVSVCRSRLQTMGTSLALWRPQEIRRLFLRWSCSDLLCRGGEAQAGLQGCPEEEGPPWLLPCSLCLYFAFATNVFSKTSHFRRASFQCVVDRR